ncbi:bestrophin [Rhizobium sp. KVB221]|uniref:Bestrophin n=1 Tax=Rhizobium setariae TaxID=2801340 RepID=A0A936YKH9_9HYPH|nr:bestrophin family ion channel [Rhizobium setariae]MBL0372044.1 bestrophin [Rhizobium setariae]
MIVRPRPNFLQLFFILRGSIIPDIVGQIVCTALIACAVVGAHRLWPQFVPVFDGAPFALVGIALSIFLGFRNNACYDRWWEARKQWGELIFLTRNFARQSLALETIPGHDGIESRGRLVRLAIAFTWALARHLRPSSASRSDSSSWLSADDAAAIEASRNRPDAVLRLMGRELARLRSTGAISDILFQTLDGTLSRMGLVQAASERLSNTPVPFAYTLLLHRTAYVFCFLLPFGFADMLGWATPFATALAAYAFFGLDALSEHLEAPFADIPNGLAISAMAETIEINLRESLGETNLPPLPQARAFILM